MGRTKAGIRESFSQLHDQPTDDPSFLSKNPEHRLVPRDVKALLDIRRP